MVMNMMVVAMMMLKVTAARKKGQCILLRHHGRKRKPPYKTWAESTLTGLEVSLAPEGTRLTLEGPHRGSPNLQCKQPSFLFSSRCLPPSSSAHIQRGPVVRQVGRAALRNSGKSKSLGKINRLMWIV